MLHHGVGRKTIVPEEVEAALVSVMAHQDNLSYRDTVTQFR